MVGRTAPAQPGPGMPPQHRFLSFFRLRKRGRSAMVVLHCCGGTEPAPLVRILGTERVTVVSRLEDFLATLPMTKCGVLSVGSELPDAVVPSLRESRELAWIVVVAPLERRVVQGLLSIRLPPANLVWRDEMPRMLPQCVERVRMEDPLQRFLHRLIVERNPPPIVCAALRRIGSTPAPPTSVKCLAGDLGVAASTFRYHWRSSLADVAPKRLLEWATLLRVLEDDREATRGASSMAMAAAIRLGRHERTVARNVRRLIGLSLGEAFDAEGRNRAVEVFERWGGGVLARPSGVRAASWPAFGIGVRPAHCQPEDGQHDPRPQQACVHG